MQGSAADDDGKGEIHSPDCASYVKNYAVHINSNPTKGEVHSAFAQSHGFIAGYLTAVNLYKANGLAEIRGGHSFETVHLFVDTYCRGAPLHLVVNALVGFVYEMERK